MAKQVHDDNIFTGVRLPTDHKPTHYELSLKPDLEKFTFEGTVRIEYNASSPSRTMVLHANELQISEGYVQSAASEADVLALETVTYSKTTETATLSFAGDIYLFGTLVLRFTGTLNDKMKGFYRTKYEVEGQSTYAATTQFEATDARRCLPCWDEPAVKATFAVTLTIVQQQLPSGRKYPVALSNMPEIERKPIPGTEELEIKFDTTPKMSIYLLAFVVGQLDYIQDTDVCGRSIRVYTIPGKSEQGRFALEVAVKSLPYYENYFNVKYPLKKMDMVAIPDFAAGAMENWGLVTYRETCLLVDPQNTSTQTKQYVAIVVAHELAHQWFGNLVTMEWWTHLWLNEGFASFMEYLCVDHIFPEYDIWSQFVTDAYSSALNLDSLHNSHPIEVPVKHPSEIDEIFDAISYDKGASVIRMLHNFIGDESFRAGMNQYLNKFAYANASTQDLWESLEAASNKPVCKLMTGWVSRQGYPWIAVSYSQVGGDAKLRLTQNRFTADGKMPASQAEFNWLVPIEAVSGTEPTKPLTVGQLEDKTGEFTVESVGDGWIKLNPNSIGLYRTQYPEELSKRLRPAISDRSLPAMDRLSLQSDFFALCKAGKVRTVELLELLQAYKDEENYTVWNSIDSCLGWIGVVIAGTEFIEKYQSFVRDLYAGIFKKLTWSKQADEQHTTAMTRALVINRLVACCDEDVVAEAKRRFAAHIDGSESIAADLRGAVYRAVSTFGDQASFDSLFKICREAELHEEKNRALRALGFTRDAERLQQVIKFIFSDEVRIQDKVGALMPIGAVHPVEAWNLFQEKKDMLRETYESGFLMSRLIGTVVGSFVSEEMAQEVSRFFEANKFEGAERTIQQSLEAIRLKASLLSRDGDSIRQYLDSRA